MFKIQFLSKYEYYVNKAYSIIGESPDLTAVQQTFTDTFHKLESHKRLCLKKLTVLKLFYLSK